MNIVGVLAGIWILNSWRRLNKSKDIKDAGWDPERNIKDKDGYIKLFSKMYFINGMTLTIWSGFSLLANLFFDIPFEASLIICAIIFIFLFIEEIMINKKRCKYLY
jgi:hypothetical protein